MVVAINANNIGYMRARGVKSKCKNAGAPATASDTDNVTDIWAALHGIGRIVWNRGRWPEWEGGGAGQRSGLDG